MNLRLYILSFCVLIGIENVFCLRGGSFTLSSSGLSIHAKSFKPFSRLQAYQQTGKHVRLPNAHPSISKSELVSVVNSVLAADVQTHFQTTASVMPHASALQGKPERKLDSKQWNELLEASLYYKQNIMVLKLMGRMRELHVALAPEVGLRLITHLAEEGDFEESRNTLQYMHNCGNAHSVHPYLALLRCSGSFTRAQSVLFLMERARLRVNVMTYSVAIKSCERTGDIASALHLLQQMRVVGIPPNDVTYCCAISVASKARRPDIAVSLLREMGTTANALSNRSTVDDSDIRDSSNEEDASGLLIGSSSSGGSASGSSSSGGSGVVNQLCYGGALTACARSGHWREVDTLLGEIVTSGAQIQETIFVAVLLALKSQDLSAKRFAGAVVPSTSTQSRSADFMASGEVVWHLDSLLRQWAPHLNCTSDRIFSLAMEMYEQHQQSALVLEAYALRERHVPAQVPVGKTLVECVMRASLNLSDADTAVQVVAQARRWGVLSTSVFLSALAVLETTQQHGRAVHLLVEAVAPPDHARMNVEGGGGDSEVDSAVGMSALQIPRPTIRQVLHNALGAITQDFMAAQQQPDSCGNESDAAATAPIALSRIQRKDVLVLLRSVLEAGEMLDPQCYPMACKLLHGNTDYAPKVECLLVRIWCAVHVTRQYCLVVRS